jgi:hypothetical protein
MATSVIFSSGWLLAGYIVALLLAVFDLKKHSTGIVFPLLSLALFMASTIVSLAYKASLTEVAVLTLIFLCLSLTSSLPKESHP